jgi:hypothetical protein
MKKYCIRDVVFTALNRGKLCQKITIENNHLRFIL